MAKSRELVKDIYLLTAQFPTEERFGLVSQLRRAAISVSSNIAEGCNRWSKKDKARFYEIAFGSLIEILNQLILSADLQFIDQKSLENMRYKIETISRMIDALHKATKR